MEKNIKDKTPINALPEYQIRTMKDDLAGQGLEKEAGTKKGAPPKKLPIIPEKTPLPTTEELIAKEEKVVKGKKAKKKKPVPRPKSKQPKAKPKPLVILIIAAIILAGVVLFFYWQGVFPPEEQPEEQPKTESIKPSESLILVNETKILSLSAQKSFLDLLKQETKSDQLAGTFKRIAVLNPSADGEKEFLSLVEFFEKLELIVPPYALTELLGPNYTLALYNQNGEKHLVIVSEVKNSENLKEQIKFWEKTMFNDLKNFFLTKTPNQPTSSEFEEIAYPPTIEPDKQAIIRYLSFPDPGLTFDYTVIKDVFVLTTNKEAIYKIVDNLLKSID